jgi:threonine/homoserine/homoserine lactone efflux protein
MDAALFIRGLAIGFAIAASLGPVGLLVIRRTIDRGWTYGIVSGLGVATADGTYGAVAAFGLTAVTEILVGVDRPLGIVGGAVLLTLAARAMIDARRAPRRGDAAPVARSDPPGLRGPVAAWASMVGLTLTNPATILAFAALFASIGAGSRGTPGATSVVVGVFLGSAAWWVILTGIVAGLRTRLTPRVIRALNVTSAVIIGGFGAVAIGFGIAG